MGEKMKTETRIDELHETFLRKNNNREFAKLKQISEITGIEITSLRRAIFERALRARKLNPGNSPYYLHLRDVAEYLAYDFTSNVRS
jgi:hypothetical protein